VQAGAELGVAAGLAFNVEVEKGGFLEILKGKLRMYQKALKLLYSEKRSRGKTSNPRHMSGGKKRHILEGSVPVPSKWWNAGRKSHTKGEGEENLRWGVLR